jgi:hypothetical protein
MSESVTVTDGTQIPFDSIANNFAYDSSGFLLTITVTYEGNTYVQTLSNNGTKITDVSRWILQAPGVTEMITETGSIMITETGNTMVTE